jgi:preprotein translocase subunit SecG
MTVLVILAMVASVLLVLVVLAQNSKGGGLSSQFGGSGASNLIGVKKTGDLLERLTWAFAIAIMIFSLGTNLVDNSSGDSDELLDKVREERIQQPNNNAVPELQNSAKPDSAK